MNEDVHLYIERGMKNSEIIFPDKFPSNGQIADDCAMFEEVALCFCFGFTLLFRRGTTNRNILKRIVISIEIDHFVKTLTLKLFKL